VVSSDPNSPSVTQIVFAPGTDGLPWSSTATLSVTYTTSSGEVRSQAGGRWHVVFNSMAHNAPSSHQGSPRPVSFSHLVFMQSVDIDLPMCLFCCVVPPVKTACEKPVTMGDCFEFVCVGVSIKPDCPSAINRRPPLVYAPVNPISLCLRLRALITSQPTRTPPHSLSTSHRCSRSLQDHGRYQPHPAAAHGPIRRPLVPRRGGHEPDTGRGLSR